MKLQDRIFNKDWNLIHPQNKVLSTDAAYVALCNELYESLRGMQEHAKISKALLRTCAINVAAYLEDIVSHIGLWKAFQTRYSATYDKQIPYFDVDDDYIKDEVNLQDIQFIVWFTIQNSVNKDFVFDPCDQTIAYIANKFYPVLLDAYETVPESEELHQWVWTDAIDKDSGAYNDLIFWLYEQSYLFSSSRYKYENELEAFVKTYSGKVSDREIQHLVLGFHKEQMLSKPIGPLGLTTSEWIVAMAEVADKRKVKKLNDIQFLSSRYFQIASETTKSYVINSSEGDEKLKLAKETFPSSLKLQKGDCFKSALIYFNGSWHILHSLITVTEEDFLSQKDLTQKHRQDAKESNDLFKSVAGRRGVLFYESFNSFVADFTVYEPYLSKVDPEVYKNILVTATPEEGLTIAPGVASYIKDPKNTLFDKELTASKGIDLIAFSYTCPESLLRILFNGKRLSEVQFVNSTDRKAKKRLQENIEFTARALRGYRV